MEPVIQYAKTSDGVNIAYYAIGAGPPLVYSTPGSHLEQEWRYREQRLWLERLAASYRLIRFDVRGTGLSDRYQVFAPDVATLDIEAVARREGLKRFALAGALSSAAIAVLYACQHPHQVSHLVLWLPYARYRDFVESSPPLHALRGAVAIDWHTFSEFMAELVTGRTDRDQARRYAAYIRDTYTADYYLRFMETFMDLDIMPQVATLTMPVLVLQRKDAVFPTVDNAREIAANAPSGRLVLVEGAAVVPFLGDTDAVLASMIQFLSETSEPRPAGLTKRELEILALLAGGASNEQISRTLSISTRTVERHIGNIYLKIGAHNRAEATAYAFRHSLVPSV
jgi:pimeloyl-ACP methyl ester carboxylesterase/DNA-binding CsgD family transcriptional regulator